MWLSDITIQNCRVIGSEKLELSPHLNLIYGSNGSGKSSFLEALSILSFGRSFRTARISDVISYHKDSVLISAEAHDDALTKRIGINKSSNKTIIRVNRQNIHSQSELSKILPLTVIHPQSHELITGGSSKRRGFLDWIAFYQYPEFHGLWKRYQYILKQRNAALRSPKLSYALEHLTKELCDLQPDIHRYRDDALTTLNKTLTEITPDFLTGFKADLQLTTGLAAGIELDPHSLIKYYNSKLAYEQKIGRTSKGSHTSDLIISLAGNPAATSASRGQTKILTLLLLLSQSLTIKQKGIIAIDDLHAEVDEDNYTKLIDFIPSLDRQVFITSTTDPDQLSYDGSHKVFHVKHGTL